VYLDRIAGDSAARIAAKLEYLNPGGSIKDRIALFILLEAEKQGFLKPGGTVIEPSSGNTGLSLAMISAVRGYHLILTMPETTSADRVRLLESYGARVVLTPAAEGMRGAIRRAQRMVEEDYGLFMPRQFSNPSNPAAHEKTTAVEIWEDTGEEVDFVVAGAGSGGTITGIAEFLKRKDRPIRIVAVEPAGSPVLSGGLPGEHRISGIGPGFVPPILKPEYLDEIVTVTDQEAEETARGLLRREGIPAGMSSGAVVFAALQIAGRPENRGKLIVAVLADSFRQL
jgi:cysteine synthase A